MVVRVGIVDLISLRPESMTRRVFLEAVTGASQELVPGGIHLETTVFGIDPRGPVEDVDWAGLAVMDALIVSGSEPTTGDIAGEPCLRIIDAMLRECAGSALLFSCQSAHAALHLLYGLGRQRLARRQHGCFEHHVVADALTTDLPETVLVPHSRWNAMLSADLRAAGVPILLDSADAEWQLAADGPDRVFIQGHPEYLCDTMAREYRRDLRRWLADPALSFPHIPRGYFPADVYARLIEHAELVRTQRDPRLLDHLPLPADYREVAADWSAHSRLFFANWLRVVAERCAAETPLAA
ncbi:homoserine O-acetyltransferase/O-succinyltransferase family protein [Nocardia inohanensis]|uniref:homoserine O-acetyltransferase/O-succinyltransferase family protein n=1 Tax=Nocardia inohanensis TaxID=209246 RepID=UPI000A524F35|nr:homoserine O-succinyltransferase [Nocardia inohanensis]